MTKSLKLSMASAIAATFAMAAPAQAASTITCDSGTNASSCTFGNTDPATGPFIDTFTFTIAWAKVLTGQFSNFYTNIGQNVNFPTGAASSTISGGSLLTPAQFTIVATPNPDIRSIGPIQIGAGTYTMSVRGHSGPNGFYSGNLALGAVPEPTSWAFMILGFGLIGAAVRRRKTETRVTFA